MKNPGTNERGNREPIEPDSSARRGSAWDTHLQGRELADQSNSARVHEARKCSSLLEIKMKARTVVGRGERGPYRYETQVLSYYWEGGRERCEDNKGDKEKKKINK